MTNPLFLFFFLICSPTMPDTSDLIAHRGASFEAPENTRAAIALAIDQGATIIEFDVRKTTDDGLYLFHDSDLKRICKRAGTFESLDSKTAAALDVGSWFEKGDFSKEKPPTLKEAIELCLEKGATPLIEHKSGSAAAYAKVLEDLGVVEKVIVQSFDWVFLAEIKQALPDLKTGALGKGSLKKFHESLMLLKPAWIGWKSKDINLKSGDLPWIKENGFKLAIWTVNDPKRARELLEAGVDKVITDRPKLFEEN